MVSWKANSRSIEGLDSFIVQKEKKKKENVLFRTMMEMPEAMDDQGRGEEKIDHNKVIRLNTNTYEPWWQQQLQLL